MCVARGSNPGRKNVVRFPNQLAFGSWLGERTPKKWYFNFEGLFLSQKKPTFKSSMQLDSVMYPKPNQSTVIQTV